MLPLLNGIVVTFVIHAYIKRNKQLLHMINMGLSLNVIY